MKYPKHLKQNIGVFIAGILFAVFCFHAWTLYSVKSSINQARRQSEANRANIEKIVQFINSVSNQGGN